MDITEFFPSNYLKASDLNGKPVRFVMSHIEQVKMRDGSVKAALRFESQDRALLLNKTNANNIAALYGGETNDWAGRPIILFPAMVDFQGKTVDAIRVRAPAAKDQPPPVRPPVRTLQQPAQQLRQTDSADLDETF